MAKIGAAIKKLVMIAKRNGTNAVRELAENPRAAVEREIGRRLTEQEYDYVLRELRNLGIIR